MTVCKCSWNNGWPFYGCQCSIFFSDSIYNQTSHRWSMSLISWLVIDYCWWSMNNRWLIEDKLFYGLLITHHSHWCHWLVIDVIDYSLITNWLLICYEFPASFYYGETLFFIAMMFTCKWSYNTGETDIIMQTKCWSQQIIHFIRVR